MVNQNAVLKTVLECGMDDLRMLDDIGYDLGEIVEDMIARDIKPTLNAIMGEVFRKGVEELEQLINDRICELEAACNERDLDEDEETALEVLRDLIRGGTSRGSATAWTLESALMRTRRFTGNICPKKSPRSRTTWGSRFRGGTMKVTCGDIIFNGWAGEENPIRYSVFVEYSGKYAKCVALSGRGRALGWVRYYASDFRNNPDSKFEVVGHLPIKETITEALLGLTGGTKHHEERRENDGGEN